MLNVINLFHTHMPPPPLFFFLTSSRIYLPNCRVSDSVFFSFFFSSPPLLLFGGRGGMLRHHQQSESGSPSLVFVPVGRGGDSFFFLFLSILFGLTFFLAADIKSKSHSNSFIIATGKGDRVYYSALAGYMNIGRNMIAKHVPSLETVDRRLSSTRKISCENARMCMGQPSR